MLCGLLKRVLSFIQTQTGIRASTATGDTLAPVDIRDQHRVSDFEVKRYAPPLVSAD